MNPSDPSNDFWELFDAACDGQLSDKDVSQLQQQLQDPERREQYLDYFELHADLYFRSCADRAERRGIGIALADDASLGSLTPDSNIGLGNATPGFMLPSNPSFRQILSIVMSMANRWRDRVRRGPAIAAAMVLIALATWFFFGPQPDILPERGPQPIAKLVASDDARWNDGLQLHDNDVLIEGQSLQLLSGRAQISMSSGAELVFKSPCVIELKRSNQVDLKEGVLSVSLADWTKSFAVVSDGVHFIDLGKQFVVSADAKTSAVEAHAIDGKLRVLTETEAETDSAGFLVSSGEAIRIDTATNSSARLRAKQELFDTAMSDASPFKPLKLHNTGLGLSPGSEDSHWKIVDASVDEFAKPTPAVVCKPYKNRHLGNDPQRSQWISVGGPDHQDCPPNTMYTFETEVDLTGYDLSSLTVVAQILADNGVTAIRINGEQVKFKPWMHNAKGRLYNAFRTIEIKTGFVDGINKIQFDVWNGINTLYPEEMNPMALRVEWQAFGRLKSPPGIALLTAETSHQVIANSPISKAFINNAINQYVIKNQN